eukprot:Plantae.Rhodophyta-Hildenbrandia_rubra.ctg6834.p1 GENE.Plantae.Rhodophyta-Hildenbrandia_rubra.ctg6834~~Plantae.Rhodophyta-Hildenbrandia_rubra.ctg6834.p1  ORF type:complete len:351 (+),score=58.69 Plantae.Rhodophyta-Hildenbrandia_rubra.ctg6834:143-1195(+)
MSACSELSFSSPTFVASLPFARNPLHAQSKYCHLGNEFLNAIATHRPHTSTTVEFANPLGIHALVFAGTWSPDDARKAISGAAAAGFDLIEIPLMERRIDATMTKKLLDEYKMGATCSLGLSWDTDISSEDMEKVKRGEEALRVAVDTAEEIGSKYVGGVLYSMLGKYDVGATEKGLQNSAEVLGRICARAAKKGITVGLEPCNRYETNVANTSMEMRQHMKRFGDPSNCVVHLDTYHVHIEEVYEEAVKNCGGKIGYVHLGDSQRGYLGSGNVDFGRIFRSLARSNYNGPLVFESFSNKIVDKSLTKALAIWREMWSDSEDLATHAHKFLQNEWAAALKATEMEVRASR